MAEYIISIHAPAKGATPSVLRRYACSLNFNPRSREGSDLSRIPSFEQQRLISIHAPAKGATLAAEDSCV